MDTTLPNPCKDIGKPCTLCCRIMAVSELAKPRYVWCRHCNTKQGCTVYQQRPQSCEDYSCLWALTQHDARNPAMPVELKPSITGVVINQTKDGKEIVADVNEGADPHKGAMGTFLNNMSFHGRVFIRHRARLRVVYQGKVVADYSDDALMSDKDADNLTVKYLPGVRA